MSQENVEAVRAAMDAFNRRDGEAFGAFLGEDAEIVPVRVVVDGTVFRGPDAAAEYCAAVEASWEDLRWEVEELRDGGEWVLALGRIRGRGRGSGAVIDARAGWVARFRAGSITNFHTYADRAQALEAVGLREQATSQENVEIVKRIYREVSSHGRAPAEVFDPQYALDLTDAKPDLGVLQGFEAAEGALREYWETFEKFRVDLQEIIHADEQRVVTAVRDGGRLKGSDAEIWNRFFHVWTFRNGKIVRRSSHADRQQALEAAGLREQGMSQENVAVVVSAIERWNCGDDAGALESFAPGVEVHHNIGRGTPLEGVYDGHTEVRKLWSDIRESFAEARFDIDRATEHDGVVLVLGTLRLRGTGSGAVADTPFGIVTEFEHGLGRRQFFWTGDQSSALAAVGLSE